jgi:hypothetical protein
MKRETTFVYYISWALSFDYLVNYNISRYAVSRLQQQITKEEPGEIKKRFGYNQTLAATISFTSLPPSPLIHWVKDSDHRLHHLTCAMGQYRRGDVVDCTSTYPDICIASRYPKRTLAPRGSRRPVQIGVEATVRAL